MLAAVAVCTLVAAAAPCGAVTANFTDADVGNSNWNDPDNWDTGFFPNNGNGGVDYDVDIDGVPILQRSAIRNTDVTIDSLTVDANTSLGPDTLSHNNSTTIQLEVVGVTNNGQISFNGTNVETGFIFNGSQSLAGSGDLVMGDNPFNTIRGISGTSTTITHGVNHTISGAGRLLNNNGGMVNNGTIRAVGGVALTINPEDVLGFTNAGTLEAAGVGGLVFTGGTFTNTLNSIDVLNGSKLNLNNGTHLIGGTLTTAGSGVVNVNGTSPSIVLLDGITNQGNVALANNREATIDNGLVNNGAWNFNGINVRAGLSFDGDETIRGTGAFVLNDSTFNDIDAINDGTITHGPNHTISGAGSILSDNGGMINQGTIRLVIDPQDTLTFQNDGTMEAAGLGGLVFKTGTFVNNTSIDVLDTSKLDLNNGTTLRGGTLTTAGTGVVNVTSNVPANLTLDGITNAGLVVHPNGNEATVVNGLTNNGTWQLNGINTPTGLVFLGDQTVGGSGAIVMSDNSFNYVEVASTLTNAANHTIRGAGALLDDTGGMRNLGTIIAEGNN